MLTLRVPFRTLFALLVTACLSLGQSVHWEPPAGSLAYNQTTELQLVFENCEPKGDPAVPAVASLQLQAVGQASNTSIVNGRVSQSVIITYHARATQKDPLTIPAFHVNTNKGRLQVAAVSYSVGDATVGQASVALDRVASSTIKVPPEVWAGEVFPIEYTMNVARRYLHSMGTPSPEWNATPVAMEEWSKPELQETVINGEQRVLIVYRSRGTVKAPGAYTLQPASHLINLTTGTASFGFFSRPNLEQYAITSDRPAFTVKPLPAPAPGTFNGAVGRFTFESKVVPTTAAVGEPVTWTLTIAGTGNWPDLQSMPTREVSRDFRVVQPQARRTLKEGTLFEGTLSEDVVLIPTQPGDYRLGPLSWTYFDTTTGSYKTIATESVAVDVTAPATAPAAPAPGTASAAAAGAAGGPPRTDVSNLKPPTLPQPIPRDALDGSQRAPLPWSKCSLTWMLLSPLPFLLVLWLALALGRARATDPLRVRREAQGRVRATLEALRQTPDAAKRRALLESWQRDAAVLCGIRHAVPHPDHFKTAAVTAGSAESELWAALWREADRALYGANVALPTDWTSRAERALQATPVAGFSFLQLFRPRNLLPFAAAAMLCLVLAADIRADEAHTAYQRGDFGVAEKAWRSAEKQAPHDWVARHNLALALAQQNRWGEASAYATSAFVQHPRDLSVRWHFNLTAERAGFAPGSLSAFLTPSTLHSIARVCSPAEWQRILLLCAIVAAVGVCCFLLVSYGRLGRWAYKLGGALVALAFVAAVFGSAALSQYDRAADGRAVIVWKPSILRSIPTEADTEQKTSPLAAGSIALAEKEFLGWTRLAFENGQTGWVRRDDLVSLWR